MFYSNMGDAGIAIFKYLSVFNRYFKATCIELDASGRKGICSINKLLGVVVIYFRVRLLPLYLIQSIVE